MGWAKYTEDNLEIINERLSRAEEKEYYIKEQAALRVTICIAPVTVTINKPITAKREKNPSSARIAEKCSPFLSGINSFMRKWGGIRRKDAWRAESIARLDTSCVRHIKRWREWKTLPILRRRMYMPNMK